jgi:hypothetical protein
MKVAYVLEHFRSPEFPRQFARWLPLGPAGSVLLIVSLALPAEPVEVGVLATGRMDDPAASKPPLSTIVEIQNHGERFFDETDAAVEALNRIADHDEVWEAARAARARADANPADQAAQQAYRAARARFFHQRIQTFLNALKFADAVRQVHEAFCNQLDIEIAAVQNQAETEQQAVQQQAGKFDDYLRQLHQVRSRFADAKEVAPQDVQLLKDLERELKNIEHQKVLAKERELLANESLRDLEETKTQANQRFTELLDEFAQARGDLSLLQGIARNDWMIVIREQRREVLGRYQQRRSITSGDNRQVVAELMGRIRERQAVLAANRPKIADGSADEDRKQVEAFLNNLPPLETSATESLAAPAQVTSK